MKIPKSLAARVDMLYQTRERRLEMQREVDEVGDFERRLRDSIIADLPKSNATGIAGKVALAKIKTAPKPRVVDWDLLWAHVKETGSFELLQRRVSDTAVAERWDAGERVPGVDKFNVVSVSLTKV